MCICLTDPFLLCAVSDLHCITSVTSLAFKEAGIVVSFE